MEREASLFVSCTWCISAETPALTIRWSRTGITEIRYSLQKQRYHPISEIDQQHHVLLTLRGVGVKALQEKHVDIFRASAFERAYYAT